MSSTISRDILDLVYDALPRQGGTRPKEIYDRIGIWSLITVRHALRILCDERRAAYEGEPTHRRYRRI